MTIEHQISFSEEKEPVYHHFCGCGAPVVTDNVPDVSDDAGWAKEAKDHNPGCEWVSTRAYLRAAPEDRQCDCCGKYSNTVADVWVPSVGDTAACEGCRADPYERHLKQTAEVVDKILGEGRR